MSHQGQGQLQTDGQDQEVLKVAAPRGFDAGQIPILGMPMVFVGIDQRGRWKLEVENGRIGKPSHSNWLVLADLGG
jgi:hypothetical protein